MESAALLAVIVIANILGAMMAVPQAARAIRTRQVAGVSAVWVGISIAANAWWIAYGLGTGSMAVVPVAVVATAGYVLIAWALLATGAPSPVRGQLLGSIGAIAPWPALVLAFSGWAAVGVLLGLLYGIQLIPAVGAAYGTHSIGGVAPTTWVLAWAEALLFGVYGFAVADAGLIVLGVCGLLGSSAILARIAWTARAPLQMRIALNTIADRTYEEQNRRRVGSLGSLEPAERGL